MSTVFYRCSTTAKLGRQSLENSATIQFQRHLKCPHTHVSDIKEHTPTAAWYQPAHSPTLIPRCQPDTVNKYLSYNLPIPLAMETQNSNSCTLSFCFGGAF